LTVFMFASRLSSLSSENRATWRGSWRRRDDADARQRLLQVRRDRGDPLARDPVGVGADDPEHEGGDRQDGEDQEGQQRELDVQPEQDRRRADQGQGRAEQGHHPVRDELVERLHVVGHPRDDHPGLAARVEADRERLQVGEDLDPEVLEDPLADPADEVGLRVRRPPVHERGDQEADDDPRERGEVAGHDALVDRELGQRRRRERGRGGGEQRDEHEDRPPAVGPQELEHARAACGRDRGRSSASAVRSRRAASARARRRSQPGLGVLDRLARQEDLVGQPLGGDLGVQRRAVEQLGVRAARRDPPCSSTTMSSASAIVESRCAITNVVRSAITSRSAVLIACSVEASTDEVASSRIRIRGSLSSARAIAIRWRWPPDSVRPRSPMRVS
jgi:hypothetical protein